MENESNNKINCPYLIDYVRECMDYIDIVPDVYTLNFCSTQRYEECPFYKFLKKIGPTCELIPICPVYKKLSMRDFNSLVKMNAEYCLNENKVKCRRYVIKQNGKKPHPDLLPDGKILE
ncbi:MAG: hypothetical protein KKB82_05680 [Candidatus Omnitrophica bacterium]|nr:hypothetical protein [Candidatus Omnitrophota bacterium]MBU1925397.1 hypothetical protein [Candidatus Omnitrophota bacterium]